MGPALSFFRVAGEADAAAAAPPRSDRQSDTFFVELDGGAAALAELYATGKEIGHGSFGKVYECHSSAEHAQHDFDESRLCVKVVPTKGHHAARVVNISDSEKFELIQMFETLRHPNIVHHHRIFQTSDMLYIVMDRCTGPELLDHAAACGGLLPLDGVRDVALQILSALATIHGLGVMHRDVKPENFRFRDAHATTLQLLDFGAAKPSSDTPCTHSVTGTLLFAAPEVFDTVYWYACDMWSAGIILFLLISGQLPFETSDVGMLRSMHHDPVLTGDSLLRGERWNTVPSAARQFVREVLTVDPAGRLSAARALEHPWFSVEARDRIGSCDSGCSTPSLLSTMNRSLSLTDIRRTYFVWNLAECNSDDENCDGEEAPQKIEMAEQAEVIQQSDGNKQQQIGQVVQQPDGSKEQQLGHSAPGSNPEELVGRDESVASA